MQIACDKYRLLFLRTSYRLVLEVFGWISFVLRLSLPTLSQQHSGSHRAPLLRAAVPRLGFTILSIPWHAK